jgi:hypothetical protein
MDFTFYLYLHPHTLLKIHFDIKMLVTHGQCSPPVSMSTKCTTRWVHKGRGPDDQLLRKASTLSSRIAFKSLLTYPSPLYMYWISRGCLILGNTSLDSVIRIPELFGNKENEWRWRKKHTNTHNLGSWVTNTPACYTEGFWFDFVP